MTVRVERYLEKAAHCEQAAERVADPVTKALYLDLASQWRQLAQQAETLDRERGDD
jgi:hypothetical protein